MHHEIRSGIGAFDVGSVNPNPEGTLEPGDSLGIAWTNPTADENNNPTVITQIMIRWKKDTALTDIDDPDQGAPFDLPGDAVDLLIDADTLNLMLDEAQNLYFTIQHFNSTGGNNGTDQFWFNVAAVPAEAGNFVLAVNATPPPQPVSPDPIAAPAYDWQTEHRTSYGAEFNPTPSPIGGGNSDYYRPVTQAQCNVTVTDRAGLLAALGTHQYIWVDSSASIDMSGINRTAVPANTVIASSRGVDAGGLIYADDIPGGGSQIGNIFDAGANTRFTGLRFRGPEQNFENINTGNSGSSAIYMFATGLCEVDNCEMTNFGRSAVESRSFTASFYVHHCTFNHNHSYSFIVANGGGANHTVEACDIRWIWNPLASSGYPGNGYELRYCVHRRMPTPAFWEPFTKPDYCTDNHGYQTVGGDSDSWVGSNYLHVHHNSYYRDDTYTPSTTTNLCSARSQDPSTPQVLFMMHNNLWFFNHKVGAAYSPTSPSGFAREPGVNCNCWIFDNKSQNNNASPPWTNDPNMAVTEPALAVAPHTQAQIIWNTPGPQSIATQTISDPNLAVDVTVNMPPGKTLNEVWVTLNGVEKYRGASAPSSLTILRTDPDLVSTPYEKITCHVSDTDGETHFHLTRFVFSSTQQVNSQADIFPDPIQEFIDRLIALFT